MMHFKKLKRLALLSGCLSICALSSQAGAQEITLKAISVWAQGNFFSVNFERFAEKVNAEGKGLVQINFLGGGPKVMPAFEVGNAVKTGVTDMASVPGGFYTTLLPEGDALSLSTLTPAEMRRNGAYDYINRLWGEKMNVRYLGQSRDSIPVHIYLRNKPVTKPDLTGLRMRVVPLYRPLLESLNSQSLLNIAPGEVYTALERGLLDGYAWPLVGLFDFNLEKHTKYRIDPGFYTVEVGILVNLNVWNKMNASQKAFLEKMALWVEGVSAAENPKTIQDEKKKLAAAGVEAITFTGDEAKELLSKAYSSVWSTLEKRSPEHGPKLRALLSK